MSIPHFHTLPIARVSPEAAGSVALTFLVPIELRDTYRFRPGQFLTLRTEIIGQSVRRSYSICSSTQRFARTGEPVDWRIKWNPLRFKVGARHQRLDADSV